MPINNDYTTYNYIYGCAMCLYKTVGQFRQKTGFANLFNANHLTQCLAHGKDLDAFGLLGELWLLG